MKKSLPQYIAIQLTTIHVRPGSLSLLSVCKLYVGETPGQIDHLHRERHRLFTDSSAIHSQGHARFACQYSRAPQTISGQKASCPCGSFLHFCLIMGVACRSQVSG